MTFLPRPDFVSTLGRHHITSLPDCPEAHVPSRLLRRRKTTVSVIVQDAWEGVRHGGTLHDTPKRIVTLSLPILLKFTEWFQ